MYQSFVTESNLLQSVKRRSVSDIKATKLTLLSDIKATKMISLVRVRKNHNQKSAISADYQSV